MFLSPLSQPVIFTEKLFTFFFMEDVFYRGKVPLCSFGSVAKAGGMLSGCLSL